VDNGKHPAANSNFLLSTLTLFQSENSQHYGKQCEFLIKDYLVKMKELNRY